MEFRALSGSPAIVRFMKYKDAAKRAGYEVWHTWFGDEFIMHIDGPEKNLRKVLEPIAQA